MFFARKEKGRVKRVKLTRTPPQLQGQNHSRIFFSIGKNIFQTFADIRIFAGEFLISTRDFAKD
jgi:hypothetical protein